MFQNIAMIRSLKAQAHDAPLTVIALLDARVEGAEKSVGNQSQLAGIRGLFGSGADASKAESMKKHFKKAYGVYCITFLSVS